jgi:enediyne biosynthesis protein E4
LSNAKQLSAYRFETTYFENKNGSFEIRELPIQMQYAPVFALCVTDVNHDGNADIISGGNLSRTRARTGMLNGNNGFVFLGDGKGNFSFVSPALTGINFTDDVRHIVADGDQIIFSINNGNMRVYRLNDSIKLSAGNKIVHVKNPTQ